jgi:hypothetical protein
MGAFISVLYTVFTAPVVIGVTFLLRRTAALQNLKSVKVMLISFILWLLFLSQVGFSVGPDALDGNWAAVPSYLSSVIFIMSGIMLMTGKRV